MRQKDIDSKKELAEIDKEVLRVKREAFHAHYQDLSTLKDTPTLTAQYSTYQPVESPYGYGNTDTLNYYKSGAATGKPALAAAGSTVGGAGSGGDWSYFDEEMLQAQRKRLFGNSLTDPPTGTSQAPSDTPLLSGGTPSEQNTTIKEEPTTEAEEKKGGEGDEGGNENEEYDPDVPTPKPKKESFVDSITRETAGIPGQYKEVDPATLYNQYYTLAGNGGGGEEEGEENEEGASSEVSRPTKHARSRGGGDENEEPPPEKKVRKEESYFVEDEWTPNKQTIFKEKVPEKTLAQLLEAEEDEGEVTFKKPKINSKRGRRKH